jgi:hypothetical protein
MPIKPLSTKDIKLARLWRSYGFLWRDIALWLAERRGRGLAYDAEYVRQLVAKARF